MHNYLYIFFCLVFGMLLLPKQAAACHEKPKQRVEKCEKPATQDVDKKKSCERDCCKKDDSKETAEQKHNCDGSCQGNCHQVLTHFNFALPTSVAGISYCVVCVFRKDNFYSSKTHTSEGFYFIWSPPNINS